LARSDAQSSSEQAPGPLGSPQVPQAAGESEARAAALADDTAKVEIRLWSSAPPHDGQGGTMEPYTIFSKRFPQP
jgi:hypothetical protein